MNKYVWEYKVLAGESEDNQIASFLSDGYNLVSFSDYLTVLRRPIIMEEKEEKEEKFSSGYFYFFPIIIDKITSEYCDTTIMIPHSFPLEEEEKAIKKFSDYLQELYNVKPRITTKYF